MSSSRTKRGLYISWLKMNERDLRATRCGRSPHLMPQLAATFQPSYCPVEHAVLQRNKFIWGPLTCQRIRFSSLNQKTRYNGSLNYQNRCRLNPSMVLRAVLADVTPTWLIWLSIHLTWHWRGAYVTIRSEKIINLVGPTCQPHTENNKK